MSVETARAAVERFFPADLLGQPEAFYLLDRLELEVRAAMPCYDLGLYVCGKGPRIVGATEYCPSCIARQELT